MKIHFRQGLVRYQTDSNGQPTFLQKSTLDGQFIDLVVSPVPTTLAFAHHSADYIFEEVRTVQKAWGPFLDTSIHFLYWDVDVLTAVLTRGFTSLPPIYSGVSPSNPMLDQHWFDSINTVMMVWNGTKWLEKIRVFAGTYTAGSVIRPFSIGTQAGINIPVNAGNLILDIYNIPLRQSDGSFVTSASSLTVISTASKSISFEAEVLNLLATTNLPRFTAVQVQGGRRCISATSTDIHSRVSGITVNDITLGSVGTIVSAGLVRSDAFTWSLSLVNRPIFCGASGELTTTPPIVGVVQQIGWVYDTDAVFIDIQRPVILDDPYGTLVAPPPGPPLAPITDFSVVPLVLVGPAPFLVNFQNTSLNLPTLLEWDFTNDGIVDSNLPNPSYTYVTPGVYSVRLKATNSYGAVENIKTNFITVTAPASTGTFTNLQLKFTVNGNSDQNELWVQRNSLFTVQMDVKNDGYMTATNIQRSFVVHDVAGNQVMVSGLPPGATQTRSANYTTVIMPLVSSMVSGSLVSISFSMLATPVAGQILRFEGAVSSPEIDVDLSNNTRAVTIEVTA